MTEHTSICADAPVIDNDRPVSAYTRTEQTRRAVRHHRHRQRRGIYRITIDVTNAQLDALEERDYLDPDRRGDRTDEAEAIEMFLRDSLKR